MEIYVTDKPGEYKEVKVKYENIIVTTNWLNESESDDLAWQFISAGWELLTNGRFDNNLKKDILQTIIE